LKVLKMNEEKEEKDFPVSVRMRKKIVELIDQERRKFSIPRSAWINQAVVEKLEKLGYEID